MENILTYMVNSFKPVGINQEINALKQSVQQIVLFALAKANFFKDSVFNGGTCLRIMHDLDRFSEDLDFSLIKPSKNFDITKYFLTVENMVHAFGLEFVPSLLDKSVITKMQSAMISGNAIINLSIAYQKAYTKKLPRNQLIKVKFEINTEPVIGGRYDCKSLFLPSFHTIRMYDLPTLFAGKIGAVLTRRNVNNTKGRDLYDFLFYTDKHPEVNMTYLRNSLIKSGFIGPKDVFNLDILKSLLTNRFKDMNFKKALFDAENFTTNKKFIERWNKESFIKAIDKIKVHEYFDYEGIFDVLASYKKHMQHKQTANQ